MPVLTTLIRDERGATAIEYGLLVAVLAMSIMASLDKLGFVTAFGSFRYINNELFKSNFGFAV